MSTESPADPTTGRGRTPKSTADLAEAKSFDPSAQEESRVSRAPVDASAIPGWGHDADDENDPTWPMRDRSFDDAPGRNWVSPPAQAQDIEVLQSIEHNRRPAVFGTAVPPAGLSGVLRRLAFRFSESRWTHWLILMAADRINVAEGVLDDFGKGRPPNLWKEFGLSAAWKYDRQAFVRRAATAVVVTGVAVAALHLLTRRRAS